MPQQGPDNADYVLEGLHGETPGHTHPPGEQKDTGGLVGLRLSVVTVVVGGGVVLEHTAAPVLCLISRGMCDVQHFANSATENIVEVVW